MAYTVIIDDIELIMSVSNFCYLFSLIGTCKLYNLFYEIKFKYKFYIIITNRVFIFID